MKIIVRSIALTCIGAVVMLIIMTVAGRMNRNVEITSNLSSCVEETVENMAVNPKYTINNVEEYVADMAEYLADRLDTDSDITVEIEKADKERGLLAVKVTEKFSHPNGKTGTVSCERIVILNKLEQPSPGEYTVKFYLSKEDMLAGTLCYKVCHLMEGDTVPAPATPQKEGATFICWRDINDYEADFSVPAGQDMIYYAVWN